MEFSRSQFCSLMNKYIQNLGFDEVLSRKDKKTIFMVSQITFCFSIVQYSFTVGSSFNAYTRLIVIKKKSNNLLEVYPGDSAIMCCIICSLFFSKTLNKQWLLLFVLFLLKKTKHFLRPYFNKLILIAILCQLF